MLFRTQLFEHHFEKQRVHVLLCETCVTWFSFKMISSRNW